MNEQNKEENHEMYCVSNV